MVLWFGVSFVSNNSCWFAIQEYSCNQRLGFCSFMLDLGLLLACIAFCPVERGQC